MATTTLAAIFNQWETLLTALTPGSRSDVTFRPAPRQKDLRQWAEEGNATSAINRNFQFRRTGTAEQPPFLDPAQIERKEEVTITVTYFAPSFRGDEGDDDVHDIMRADARQIYDSIFSASNYVSGQNLALVEIQAPEAEENVWIQELTVTVYYYEAQSL